MSELIELIKLFYKSKKIDANIYEEDITFIKENVIERWKQLLEWLIKNNYIEEIPSEKKSWPDVNDYIKYIADTEDPIKTLSDMIKTEEKK